jgi:hypothetical protein
MPQQKSERLPVTFVDLKETEQVPRLAAYLVDAAGQPGKKLGSSDGGQLILDGTFAAAAEIVLGPDSDDPRSLDPDSLMVFRVPQMIEGWRKNGLVLGRDVWERFVLRFTCVSGTVRKCRPWFWELFEDIRLRPLLEQAQAARIKPITAELQPHILFPLRCQEVCDGLVEIYERVCCCHGIRIPDLLERLRDILELIPIPIPDPDPGPLRSNGPGFSPSSGADPARFEAGLIRRKAQALRRQKKGLDLAAVPPPALFEDYLALRRLPEAAAQAYVRERPYLYPIFCHCSLRKVGEAALQPGGHFSLCYLRPLRPIATGCTTTYAYRVRQLLNGAWTVIYDGLAAHQYFAAHAPADVRSYDPRARGCADPGTPPPNGGQSFVMLEHVGSYGSFHFNFPAQNGVSQVAALDADDGTFTTSYAPDCPWGGALGLRLWVSPELAGTVAYYRLKAVPVSDAGLPTGTPVVLDASVTWDKLVDVPGDVVRAPETLGPFTVGAEDGLFRVPYWSSPDHRYLSGQYHQVWNTAQPLFADRRYLLLVEVFDAGGNRIKPNGASGPGTPAAFQFRRWASATDTDPVPFADAAHVFWVDNTPVGGDLVDLRKDGAANTQECQFLSGYGATQFSVGFRAYHVHGVEHAGNGDDNSFLFRYGISWQRGLNGSTGTLGPAPAGGTDHTDVGETGAAAASGSASFEQMLSYTDAGGTTVVLPKCSFSVTLNVYAKHFTGSGRINAYDYRETASFALELLP